MDANEQRIDQYLDEWAEDESMVCEFCGHVHQFAEGVYDDFGPVFCRDTKACFKRWRNDNPTAAEDFERMVYELRAAIVPVEEIGDEHGN